MKPTRLFASVILLLTVAREARADDLLFADPVFRSLVADCMARNPDLAAADRRIGAARERVPQAASLADPTVSIGYQNDGFTSLPLGQRETTFLSISATQPVPFPGKRPAREAQANAEAAWAQARIDRPKRALRADMARAYVGLLWVRAQLALLQSQEQVWAQMEALARARYPADQGTQADLTRAQLERTKLRQIGTTLRWDAEARRLELNRLAVRPIDAPVEPSDTLTDLPLPDPPTELAERLVGESPELAVAQAALRAADRRMEVARLERKPDFALTVGLMPRGAMVPMWLVQVSATLPVYAANRQDRAVRESELNAEGAQFDVDGVQQQIRWRTRERMEKLASVRAILQIYRETLLHQAQAAVEATLRQYAVGRAPFAAVLEAINGRLADEANYLTSLASAQAIRIALYEADLGPVRDVGGGPTLVSGAAVPDASNRPGAPTGGM